MINGSRAAMADAIDDMIRVLDVVDAMHADTPDFAATVLGEMGPIRTAEAALRVIDVLVHVVIGNHPNGVSITAEDFTAYVREHLGGRNV